MFLYIVTYVLYEIHHWPAMKMGLFFKESHSSTTIKKDGHFHTDAFSDLPLASVD